jgi:deazaflavin-dependent oxidoreductase (nitroreductase family)
MSDWNDKVIAEFTAGELRIANMFDRSALMLLGTTGARTGQARTSPVVYFRDGESYLVVASAAGHEKHPAWFINLEATPAVSVQVWADDVLEEFAGIATPVAGAERDELFAGIVAAAPGFGEYQSKTSRVIPVVRIIRA